MVSATRVINFIYFCVTILRYLIHIAKLFLKELSHLKCSEWCMSMSVLAHACQPVSFAYLLIIMVLNSLVILTVFYIKLS